MACRRAGVATGVESRRNTTGSLFILSHFSSKKRKKHAVLLYLVNLLGAAFVHRVLFVYTKLNGERRDGHLSHGGGV